MMIFLKGEVWQEAFGMDFLGFTKCTEEYGLLFKDDVDGLSDRQIRIVSGRTGWTKNKLIFVEGYGHNDKK